MSPISESSFRAQAPVKLQDRVAGHEAQVTQHDSGYLADKTIFFGALTTCSLTVDGRESPADGRTAPPETAKGRDRRSCQQSGRKTSRMATGPGASEASRRAATQKQGRRSRPRPSATSPTGSRWSGEVSLATRSGVLEALAQVTRAGVDPPPHYSALAAALMTWRRPRHL